MATKDEIEHIAKTIDISYNDCIQKKELMQLFELEEASMTEGMTLAQYRKQLDDSAWAFLSAMEAFKFYLREHRNMHLEPLRKNFTYRVIRPSEHTQVALGHLKKAIDKGFKSCHEILNSTQETLLTSSEKLALTNAQVKVARLESMMNRKALKDQVFDRFKELHEEEKKKAEG